MEEILQTGTDGPVSNDERVSEQQVYELLSNETGVVAARQSQVLLDAILELRAGRNDSVDSDGARVYSGQQVFAYTNTLVGSLKRQPGLDLTDDDKRVMREAQEALGNQSSIRLA